MLKKLCPLWIFFLSFYFSTNLIGNELTRRAIEGEEIAGKTYYGFSYEPILEDWTGFNRYMHLSLLNVGEEWITYLVEDEIKKAVKARLTKEMEIFSNLAKNSLENNSPPELDLTVDLNYNVVVEAEDRFNFLPIQAAPDEEWDTTQINAKVTMKFDIQGLPDFQNAADMPEVTLDFTILETGKILGKETVVVAAGTFEDCLKIEYRTETEMTASGPTAIADSPGESITTLWFAPNVGIVKFHQQSDKIFLKMISERDVVDATLSDEEAAEITAPSVETLELKKYEIASDLSQDDANNK